MAQVLKKANLSERQGRKVTGLKGLDPQDSGTARTLKTSSLGDVMRTVKRSTNSTVLFADVSESTQLYETAGDSSAAQAINRCMRMLRHTTESLGGRVVKTIGDEVMAVFTTPDAAAIAAARMHTVIDTIAPVAKSKLGVRIGFQSGPVVQRDNDVFGGTVNMASRLAAQAVKGQTLTSEETALLLSPIARNQTRSLYPVQLKGKAKPVSLCEVVWRRSPDMTDLSTTRAGTNPSPLKLNLSYRGRELAGLPGAPITVGRDNACTLVLVDPKTSRHHCTIERQQDGFVLQDHSSNGTYVTVEGENEIVLLRHHLTLRTHGFIAFGQPRSPNCDVVEFMCGEAIT